MFTFILESTRELLQKKNQGQMPLLSTVMDGDLVVLALSGKLDSSSAALLKARVQELSGQGFRKLVLDLHSVTSMDSSGLGEIVSVNNRFASEGGELCLAALSDRLRRLFEYAKLHVIFRIFADVPAATEYLNR